jgi:hypothetical protein
MAAVNLVPVHPPSPRRRQRLSDRQPCLKRDGGDGFRKCCCQRGGVGDQKKAVTNEMISRKSTPTVKTKSAFAIIVLHNSVVSLHSTQYAPALIQSHVMRSTMATLSRLVFQTLNSHSLKVPSHGQRVIYLSNAFLWALHICLHDIVPVRTAMVPGSVSLKRKGEDLFRAVH